MDSGRNSTDSSRNQTLDVLRESFGCNICSPIDISERVPVDLAVPLYGYVMPIIIAVTLVTNSFIVVVLNQKHLRTPTNYVLLSMAVAELLTGNMISIRLRAYLILITNRMLAEGSSIRRLPVFAR